jgi:hypothetical protein
MLGIALWMAVGANASGAEVGHEIWTLTIRPGLSGDACAGGRANYWVGLRNPGKRDRVVCLSSLTFAWTGSEQTPVGGTLGNGSIHACQRNEEKHLLLAGQTLFVSQEVPCKEGTPVGTLKLRAEVEVASPIPGERSIGHVFAEGSIEGK